MQAVSQAWKDNQRQNLVSESFIEISMRVGDPLAQASAELADNGHESIANPLDIIADTAAPVKYASLEPGLWILDGTFKLAGDDTEETTEGFIPKEEEEPLVAADGKIFYVAV